MQPEIVPMFRRDLLPSVDSKLNIETVGAFEMLVKLYQTSFFPFSSSSSFLLLLFLLLSFGAQAIRETLRFTSAS
jgi:hypothetical protein